MTLPPERDLEFWKLDLGAKSSIMDTANLATQICIMNEVHGGDNKEHGNSWN